MHSHNKTEYQPMVYQHGLVPIMCWRFLLNHWRTLSTQSIFSNWCAVNSIRILQTLHFRKCQSSFLLDCRLPFKHCHCRLHRDGKDIFHSVCLEMLKDIVQTLAPSVWGSRSIIVTQVDASLSLLFTYSNSVWKRAVPLGLQN